MNMISAIGRQRLSLRLVGAALKRILVSNFTSLPSNSWDCLDERVSKYAVVDHGREYEDAMKGRHGAQLQLAQIDGVGKDDMPFDPFKDIEDDELVDEFLNKLGSKYDEYDDEDEEDDLEELESNQISEAEILSETTTETAKAEDEELNDDEELSALEYIDEVDDELSGYNNDGSPRYSKAQLANFRAGFPAGGLFAVINIIGSQNKVTIDDVVVLNRLKPRIMWPIGSIHTIKDVLLVGSSHKTLVGMPHVAGAEVDVMVEEITRDAKVVVFKKRRRKNSQSKNGFRRDVTLLRILDIRFPPSEHDHVHTKRVEVMPNEKRQLS